MTTYLDTNVAIWLAQGATSRISSAARDHLKDELKLRVSPMVLLELEYLYEVKKILLPARDLQRKLNHELGVEVCDMDFPTVAEFAQNEKWTRDPFDRMIVAHAKANALAWLVSSDQDIGKNYPRTIW